MTLKTLSTDILLCLTAVSLGDMNLAAGILEVFG